MVICKYYLQGRCYYGSQCRFEHTDDYTSYSDNHSRGRDYGQSGGYRDNYSYQSGGRQHYDQYYYDDSHSHRSRGQGDQYYYDDDNSYDSGAGGYHSGGGHRGRGSYHDARGGYASPRGRDNYYDNRQRGDGDWYSQRADGHRATSSAQSARSYAPSTDLQSTNEYLSCIREDMETWENSGMWPYSCFAFTREASSLPGLEDLSMEEVRLNAYEAKATGNLNAYVSWVEELSKDYAAKRQQLKRPAGAIKDALIQEIEVVNRDGIPVNTAARQKASTDVSVQSLGASSLPPSAGVAAPVFDAFSTGTFGASSTDVFPQPVNSFSTTPPSTFSQPGSAVGGFGGMSSSQPQMLFGSAQSTAATDSSHRQSQTAVDTVYTPLDQLSAKDRAQYDAPKFTLGQVPVRRPPKELI